MNIVVDSLKYEINSSNKEAIITGVELNSIKSSLIVPDSITYNNVKYYVVTIGKGAFESCDKLQNIKIPNSVTSIGKDTFQFCRNLKNIIIPNSVTFIGK